MNISSSVNFTKLKKHDPSIMQTDQITQRLKQPITKDTVSFSGRSDSLITIKNEMDAGKDAYNKQSYSKAESHFRNAVLKSERELGEKDTVTGEALENLGLVLLEQGKNSDAIDVYKKAYKTNRSDSTEKANILNNIAVAYANLGEYERAKNALENSLEITRLKFGDNHPETNSIRENITAVQQEIQRQNAPVTPPQPKFPPQSNSNTDSPAPEANNDNTVQENQNSAKTFGNAGNSNTTKVNNDSSTKSSSDKNGLEGGLNDIAGMKELKNKLKKDIIGPIKFPDQYKKYGLTIPSGILMYGPPGCGKTFAAKKLGKELGLEFIMPTTQDMQSPQGIEKFFNDAKQKVEQTGKPVTIFIDEFEIYAPSRSDGNKSPLTNELLKQLNDSGKDGLIVIVATNEPEQMDHGIIRPGRFDDPIYVGPPDYESRLAQLNMHIKGRYIDKSINKDSLESLAKRTEGYTAAGLELLVNNAAKTAIKEDVPISMKHLETIMPIIGPKVSKSKDLEYRKFATRGNLEKENVDKSKLGLNKIAGMKELKEKIKTEIVDPMKNRMDPDKKEEMNQYDKYKIDPTAGILLFGPGGCGKTFFTKAVAEEMGMHYQEIEGS